MITRSQLSPLPQYFDRYINMVDDVDVIKGLETSLKELNDAPIKKWKAIGSKVYAPGKWTINDILQHVTDTERVFAYRALSFARGEKDVRPFDENLYGQNAEATNRRLEDILEELIAVRKTSILLYKSFNETMLNRKGVGFKGEYSVHDIGFIIAGHQRWHWRVIEEKYFPLL
jgi:hypothetical protein